MPGITSAPGQASEQIRQYIYPRAAGGTVIYTPPKQQGFGQPLQITGWLRGTPQLAATLTRLGVPANASPPSAPSVRATAPTRGTAPKTNDTTAPAWLIATIASAIAIACTVLWLRRRPRPAADKPVTGRTAARSDQPAPHLRRCFPEYVVDAGRGDRSSSSRG